MIRVSVPSPNARPTARCRSGDIPRRHGRHVPFRLPIRFSRIALPCSPSIGRPTSVTKRFVPSVPNVMVPVVIGGNTACLVTWLTTPPVDPRPNKTDAGPFSTSIELQVERVTCIAAEITHAVQVEIVAGREAAQRQVVALGAGFPRTQADARHVSQRIPQRHVALVLHQFLRHNVDRLRRIQQRLRQPPQRRNLRLVAVALDALHRHRRQLHCVRAGCGLSLRCGESGASRSNNGTHSTPQ